MFLVHTPTIFKFIMSIDIESTVFPNFLKRICGKVWVSESNSTGLFPHSQNTVREGSGGGLYSVFGIAAEWGQFFVDAAR